MIKRAILALLILLAAMFSPINAMATKVQISAPTVKNSSKWRISQRMPLKRGESTYILIKAGVPVCEPLVITGLRPSIKHRIFRLETVARRGGGSIERLRPTASICPGNVIRVDLTASSDAPIGLYRLGIYDANVTLLVSGAGL